MIGLDASPFMLVVGKRQNRGLPNLEFKHALAEDRRPKCAAEASNLERCC